MAEYLKFLKASLSLATATFGTVDIQMPVQRGQGRGMNLAVVIHQIEYELDATVIVALDGSSKYVYISLSKTAPTTTPTALNASDLVDRVAIQESLVTDIGMNNWILPIIHKFNPPLLVPNEKLVLAMLQNSGATAGLTVRIGYTIRSVSNDEMYAALNNQ